MLDFESDDMLDVSVIVACYNGARTLPETLDGLVAQVWDGSWEILFCDNGSTDASRAIFEGYARAHPGLDMRVVGAGQERGKVYALNAGLRAARGRAFLFCDSDDTVPAGWLAAMTAALAEHDFIATYIDTTVLNHGWVRTYRAGNFWVGLRRLSYPPHCAIAGGGEIGFTRRVYETVGGFDPAFVVQEDHDFCVRAHLAGFDLHPVPETRYNYRFRDDFEGIYRQAFIYARYRALLRQRCGAAEPFLTPRPWLKLGKRLLRLYAGRARALLRGSGPADRARFAFNLGSTLGDAAGAIAFRVAPPRRRASEEEPGGRHGQGHIAGLKLSRRGRLVEGLLRPFFGSVVGVRMNEPTLALTFDDGPDPDWTPAVLDALRRHGMRATFFLVGERAERHPELVARIRAEGHETGSHSWSHPSLPELPLRAAAEEIARTRALLGPQGAALFRPPYGHQSLATWWLARLKGYRVVMWTLAAGDWRGDDGAAIAARILAIPPRGAIVLMHDSLCSYEDPAFRDRGPTIAALGILARQLAGYQFVTVSELLRRGRAERRYWSRRGKPRWLARQQAAPVPEASTEASAESPPGPAPEPAGAPR